MDKFLTWDYFSFFSLKWEVHGREYRFRRNNVISLGIIMTLSYTKKRLEIDNESMMEKDLITDTFLYSNSHKKKYYYDFIIY